LGIQILRFNALEVKRNMPGVLSVISNDTPLPLSRGELYFLSG